MLLSETVLILSVCKNKRKIPKIKRLLAQVELTEDKTAYLVPSTDKKKDMDFRYEVSLDANGKFYCKCDWILFKPYTLGMKKYRQVDDCIHILTVKCYILLERNK